MAFSATFKFHFKRVCFVLLLWLCMPFSRAQDQAELSRRFGLKEPKDVFDKWYSFQHNRKDLYIVIKEDEWIVLFQHYIKQKPCDSNPKLRYELTFLLANLLHSTTRFNEAIPVLKELLDNKRYIDKARYELVLLKLEESYINNGDLKSGISIRKRRIEEGMENSYWQIYREAGVYRQAINEYKTHVDYPKGNPWFLIFYHLDLGNLYFRNNDLDSALQQFNLGYTAANTICHTTEYKEKSPYSEYSKFYFRSLMKGNMAQVYLKRKQLHKAIPLFLEDIEKSKSINEIGNAMLKRLDLADCYIQLKQYPRAKNYLDTVSELIKTTKIYYYDFRLFELKAAYFTAVKEFDSATVYLNKYLVLKEELNEKNRKNNIIGLIQFFETEQQQAQIVKQQLALADAKLKAAEGQVKRNRLIALAVLLAAVSLGMFFYSRQKTKRKIEIEKSLQEKEILLKEIHHRVKNNLTTLKSLLFLQGRASNNAEVKEILQECETRIQSMALIHQNLYQDSENGKIAFLQFLKEMLQHIAVSFNKHQEPVELHFLFEETYLEMSQGLFLGLIVNELATNSYKYAFNENRQGEIRIDFALKNGQLELRYQDNGPGLNADFGEPGTSGFGFKLIRILVDQIDGKIEYSKAHNTSIFIIRIHDKSLV